MVLSCNKTKYLKIISKCNESDLKKNDKKVTNLALNGISLQIEYLHHYKRKPI